MSNGHAGHAHSGAAAGHLSRPAEGSHPTGAGADAGWLGRALALIVAFMIGEVLVGLLAHSLALVSDAAHMLTDAASIVLALVTMRLAARPPKGGYTYGLKRAEILSAQANGITLLLLSAWLAVEAIRRLITPPQVAGGLVLVTALAGVAVNLGATWMVSRASRTSLNVEGAVRHIVTDLYAFIATAIAGVVILTTGFARADAIASLIVVLLMIKAGAGLVRESGRIFLEAAPSGLRPDEIGQAMAARPDVAEVHDLHIWQITSGMPAASAHVLVAPGRDCHAVRGDLEQLLTGTYKIAHTTLQVDHAPQEVFTIAGLGPRASDPHCNDPHGPVHRPPGPRPPETWPPETWPPETWPPGTLPGTPPETWPPGTPPPGTPPPGT
jgi:cobalt-zinc-cadmium efflux system protein